jgi:hypothetical protein
MYQAGPEPDENKAHKDDPNGSRHGFQFSQLSLLFFAASLQQLLKPKACAQSLCFWHVLFVGPALGLVS